MTNNFIPTLPRHTLYCVWIRTGDLSRPLECVWIDPEFRSFQITDIEQTAETNTKAMRGVRCGCGVVPEARNGSALTFYSHVVLVEALQ
jgi:hypothetical protein